MINQISQSDDAVIQYRFTAYVTKAVQNYKADYYNQQKKIKSFEIPVAEIPDEPDPSNYEQFDLEGAWGSMKDYVGNEKLAVAMFKLSDMESVIIFMRMVREMSPTEIARSLGKNVSAINKMYYRAITKLRNEMECPLPRGGRE